MAEAPGRVSDSSADIIQQSAFAALPAATQAALLTTGVHIVAGDFMGGNAPLLASVEAKRNADARAESFLRSWLTSEQREQRIHAAGVFTVRGGSTGKQYQLGFGSCYELGDNGQNVAHLCFGPTDFRLPLPDRVLAQKLALECDEETVLRVANRMPFMGPLALLNTIPPSAIANAEALVALREHAEQVRCHRALFCIWCGLWVVGAVLWAFWSVMR